MHDKEFQKAKELNVALLNKIKQLIIEVISGDTATIGSWQKENKMHDKEFQKAKELDVALLNKIKQLTIEVISGDTAMSTEQYMKEVASLIDERKNLKENYPEKVSR